ADVVALGCGGGWSAPYDDGVRRSPQEGFSAHRGLTRSVSSLDISLGAPPEHAETAATPNSPTNDRRLPHAAQKLDAARSGRTEQEARPNRARRQSFRSALNTGDDAMPFKRRNAGRGHYYVDEDGTRFDGVTTLLGEGLPKPALVNWAANTTADYAVDHWDELSRNTISERINKLR